MSDRLIRANTDILLDRLIQVVERLNISPSETGNMDVAGVLETSRQSLPDDVSTFRKISSCAELGLIFITFVEGETPDFLATLYEDLPFDRENELRMMREN